MGQHKTPRGEESTYRANGGKQSFPYKGRHRDGETPAGHEMTGKISDRIRKGTGDWKHESQRDSQ